MNLPAAIPPLPPAVQALLRAQLPAAGPLRWAARSGTRVDTGQWFRRAPLFAALLGDWFAVVAPGPRPLVRLAAATCLGHAVYNHVTGELAFPAAAALPPLRLDPMCARSLLNLAQPGEFAHA